MDAKKALAMDLGLDENATAEELMLAALVAIREARANRLVSFPVAPYCNRPHSDETMPLNPWWATGQPWSSICDSNQRFVVPNPN